MRIKRKWKCHFLWKLAVVVAEKGMEISREKSMGWRNVWIMHGMVDIRVGVGHSGQK
jgi:hypothetical protein